MLMLISGILFAYLCGSLSSAIILSRLFKLPDPRSHGSGNPGTTNILRLAGKKFAVIVLIGDLLKGLLPVLLAKIIGFPAVSIAWLGLAAVIGHLFPVFFQFKGGKGVATAAGVLLALSWPLGCLAIATWILIAGLFRYSSLAALIATLMTPIYSIWFLCPIELLPVTILCLIVIWRHRENIQRLRQGKETKMGRTI